MIRLKHNKYCHIDMVSGNFALYCSLFTFLLSLNFLHLFAQERMVNEADSTGKSSFLCFYVPESGHNLYEYMRQINAIPPSSLYTVLFLKKNFDQVLNFTIEKYLYIQTTVISSGQFSELCTAGNVLAILIKF